MKDLVKTYASNLEKVLYHTEHLNDIKVRSIIRPITVDLNPSGYCNGGCNFCTQVNMPKVNIDYDLAKKGLRMYREAGAVGLELTGGGEPLMHPKINELIDYADNLGYSIGMITNGTLIDDKLRVDAMKKLTWLRVSLNPIYHKGLSFPIKPIVHYDGTYGANFVWEEGMDEYTLAWVFDAVKQGGFSYVKITPDVLSSKNAEMINWLEEQLKNTDYPIFAGGRTTMNTTNIPSACFAGYLKPHINQDGKVYRCSCASWELKQYPEYAMIADLNDKDFTVPLFYDNFSTSQCTVCHYEDLNNLVKMLLSDLKHGDFI